MWLLLIMYILVAVAVFLAHPNHRLISNKYVTTAYTLHWHKPSVPCELDEAVRAVCPYSQVTGSLEVDIRRAQAWQISSLITEHCQQCCKFQFENVKYSHTQLWALGMELIPVSWLSACRWLCQKHGGRLPLLSSFHQVRGYFPGQRDHPLGQYQITLLGDRGTQV